MNPPYSQWQKWVAKAAEEAAKGATVVALLPARTDTKAFHAFIWQQPNVEIRFIRGRITFVGAPDPAPFPSMIVVFNPHPQVGAEDPKDCFFLANTFNLYKDSLGIDG